MITDGKGKKSENGGICDLSTYYLGAYLSDIVRFIRRLPE
jgi:hypothetical protein